MQTRAKTRTAIQLVDKRKYIVLGSLELRHLTFSPEDDVRELLSCTFRSITKLCVYTATEELLEACVKNGMELSADGMPALNILTFCFGHLHFGTRRCLTVREAYTTSGFIEQLVQVRLLKVELLKWLRFSVNSLSATKERRQISKQN